MVRVHLPSKKAIASIKSRVKAMTYRSTLHHEPGYLMEYLGRVLRGWAEYFRHGVSKATFAAIDSYTWEQVTAWLRDKHRIGWPELRRRFCLPRTWRLTADGVRFQGAASVGHPIPLRLPDPDPVDTGSHHRLTDKPLRGSPVR